MTAWGSIRNSGGFILATKKVLKHFLFWVAIAAIFNLIILIFLGQEKAMQFLGGYVIEQSLSLDNLFVFLAIFSSFGLSPSYQKRVLNYGIFTAMVLRFIFISFGIAMVTKFHWILYIFGAILIYSGFKIVFSDDDEEKDFKNSKLIKFLSKLIPFTHEINGKKFFIKQNGLLYATPLLAVLIIIETSDIIFAIDSIPAIFAISTNTFIVYSSNIFAILGLRNLYFLIEKLNQKFVYVKYGVAGILVFTGAKLALLMIHVEISIFVSILFIVGSLLISILVSMLIVKKPKIGVHNIHDNSL